MSPADSRADKVLRFEALRVALAAPLERDRKPAETLATGCAAVDGPVGGLLRGAVNELSGSTGSGPLFFDQLLHESQRSGWRLALVDAADNFDPSQFAGPLLARTLWVRCRDVQSAIRSTDLLVRDGNFSLVVLDLQGTADARLRKVPASTWHRFARLLESTGATLLVMSRRPVVEGARLRLHCDAAWPLDALERPRDELTRSLRLDVRQRAGWEIRRSA